MALIAKVRFLSPLPALDKVFDYIVPKDFENLVFGQLVKAPFGADKKTKNGVVVGLSNESDYSGKLVELTGVESRNPVITKEQFDLLELVAARFLGSTSELLNSVIPKKSVRVDKNWTHAESVEHPVSVATESKRIYLQPEIMRKGLLPNWSTLFAEKANEVLEQRRSVIISVPDFRDLENLKDALSASDIRNYREISSSISNGQNYENYLTATSQVGIYIGLRSMLLQPAFRLGAILVLDDGDESHLEPTSPYWNTRDLALLRQSLEKCELVFSSLSPSSEVVRLTELGFLEHQIQGISRPAVRIAESRNRLDDATFSSIAKAIAAGQPVLIQIANLGYATAIACTRCAEIRTCACGSRIWIDTKRQFRCRSCKSTGVLPPCQCGEQRIRIVRTGSSAIVEWLKTSFKNAKVIHSSAEERILRIDRGANLVIATPGAEPEVNGGYSYVVLADAYNMVGAPRLRALEKSLLLWANAVEKLSSTGTAIFVGLTGDLARRISRLEFFDAMREDYLERVELGLPPTRRIAAISCKNSADLDLLKSELVSALIGKITPLPSSDNETILFCYNFADSEEVAKSLRAAITEISSKSKNKLPGQRLFRVRLDDPNSI